MDLLQAADDSNSPNAVVAHTDRRALPALTGLPFTRFATGVLPHAREHVIAGSQPKREPSVLASLRCRHNAAALHGTNHSWVPNPQVRGFASLCRKRALDTS
jgi:hypothetical protein